MLKAFFIVVGLLSFIFASNKECKLIMVYKNSDKPPYMFKDGSGIYKDVYEKAAKMIGCSLGIKREPKKRAIEDLKTGKADFYPIFGYSKKRADYVYYLKSYICNKLVFVTRKDTPNISKKSQIKKLVIIKERCGYSPIYKYANKFFMTDNLGVKKYIDLLLNKRADAFLYHALTVEHAIKKWHIKDIKLNYKLFKDINPSTFGFSRKSKYLKVIPNPNFDKSKPRSINNFPVVLSENSIAYKFQKALYKLKESGFTDEICRKYR